MSTEGIRLRGQLATARIDNIFTGLIWK